MRENPIWAGGVLAATALFSFAYFYQAGGWNQNSRFDLVESVVAQGKLSIDDLAGNTGDKAFWQGHYYCDKAPGLSLAAIPVVAVARQFVGRALQTYLATIFTVAIPLAGAVLLLYSTALRLGASPGGAGFCAVVFALGTPMWPYATLFWGHGLAAACLVFSFAAALRLQGFSSARRDWLYGSTVGAAAGWAVVTEFPAGPAAGIFCGLALFYAWPDGWARRRRIFAAVCLGASAGLLVLLSYQWASFGSPFHLGYSSVEGFSGMKEGVMGITYPKAGVLLAVLFGRFRGLFRLAPVLLTVPAGFWLLLRDKGGRAASWAAILAAAYYILFNASFHYWGGGWSFGPRHLSPALPFLCLALAPIWTAARPSYLRLSLSAAALWGVGTSLVAVATTVQPPDRIADPMGELLWPAFTAARFSLNQQSFFESMPGLHPEGSIDVAWNIGKRLGLRGFASLAPLFVAWGAGGLLFLRCSSGPGGPRKGDVHDPMMSGEGSR